MSKHSTSTVEGRATLARPSLCLLFALLGASLFLAAPARAAQLPEVVLTETDPHSTEKAPVKWTTPRVKGGPSDGGGINSFPSRSEGSLTSAYLAAADVDIDVTLFTNPGCTVEVASGDLAELQDEGIEVEVPADSVTTFYAIQADSTDVDAPSNCSKSGLTYWASSTGVNPGEEPPGGGGPPTGGGAGAGEGAGAGGPPPAPRLRLLPGARANDNAPRVTGSAPDAATVKVFSATGCAGPVLTSGSAADLANGLRVDVKDNTTNTFTAVSVAAGKGSACSDPVTYVEDSLAPRTRITMGPGVKTRRRKAVFRFTDTTDDPPGTSFFCKVNRGKWKPCHSPFKLRHLGRRSHILRVRAVDLAGNAESKGSKRRFKVIRSS